MARAPLTKQSVKETKAIGRDLIIWDSGLPGFGLRVKPSGVKTYLVQYRNRYGRSKRLSLGQAGILTLEQARKEAKRVLGKASLGDDPAQDRLADRSVDTIRELSDRYMKDHCPGHCKASTIKAYRWLLDKYILPKLGAHRLTELTARDIAKFHQSLRQTPYNANRSLGLLRAMYSKAEEWGLISRSSNPARAIRSFPEQKKERYLDQEEFVELFTAVRELETVQLIDVYQAAAIRLLVLTGCRLNEILSLKWSEVDLARRQLILSEHKTSTKKGLKRIPLNSEAVKILENLPRRPRCDWVICGRKPKHHLVNLRKPWLRVLKQAGLKNVRLHDLRHSYASVAASNGVPIGLVGALLGHSSPQSTSRYAHFYEEPLRAASEATATTISSFGVIEE